MSDNRGFSLIELLIVVAVILIIAAIAIPNLLRSKIAANESSAVASVRTIDTAQIAYSVTYGGYADDMAKLGPASGAPDSNKAGLIDSSLASGDKSGYHFALADVAPTAFTIHATPIATNKTGLRRFCASQENVIHYDDGTGTCVVGSSPVLR